MLDTNINNDTKHLSFTQQQVYTNCCFLALINYYSSGLIT